MTYGTCTHTMWPMELEVDLHFQFQWQTSTSTCHCVSPWCRTIGAAVTMEFGSILSFKIQWKICSDPWKVLMRGKWFMASVAGVSMTSKKRKPDEAGLDELRRAIIVVAGQIRIARGTSPPRPWQCKLSIYKCKPCIMFPHLKIVHCDGLRCFEFFCFGLV